MTIIGDVLAELFGMFLGDLRLSAAIGCVVALAAALVRLSRVPTILAGGVLLLGCLAVVLVAVLREAKQRAGRTQP